jgi:glutaredoxin
MKKFIMYTKPSCGFCIRAKNLLAERGFQYEERVVGSNHAVGDVKQHCLSLNESAKVNTVPQIIFEEDGVERYVGGYTELAATIENY